MKLTFSIICYFLLLFSPCIAGGKSFILVLDPGHGGKDPGALGKVAKEKAINLQVAIKLGDLIEKNYPDVKVVYTRKTDKFVELNQRADIANKANADLFISIHANALKNKSFQGTETFTLGLARTDENLEVAKRENSAILLEDDYKQKYEGFDPNSTESYIIFEFMQNKFMEQSLDFASYIQKEFKACNRIDRGVKQAGFLVLRKTSMPSVLVELGFLTNASEEKFMVSNDGQNKLALSIYKAFAKYKKAHDRKMGLLSSENKRETKTETVPPNTTKAEDGIVYKVQILTSSQKLSLTNSKFKRYKNIGFYIDKGIYKYTYGESRNEQEMVQLLKDVSKDFKDAFIVEFKNGKRIK